MYIRDIGTRQIKRTRPLVIKNGAAAVRQLHYIARRPREHLVVILLNSNFQVIGVETIYLGTIDMVDCEAADVFRPAIIHHAAYIIIAHNHPDGDLTPTQEDVRAHYRFDRVGNDLQIRVLDNIIISRHGYRSIYRHLAVIRGRAQRRNRRHGKQ